MGKASTRAQNRYIAKAYDRINLTVPKGRKDIIQEYAQQQGESVNAFIGRAISETMARDSETTPKIAQNGPESTPGTGVVSLPSETVRTTQEAAGTGTQPTPVDKAKATENLFRVLGDLGTVDLDKARCKRLGVMYLPPDTLEAAQRAAVRTGETVVDFVARSIAEQEKRDDRSFKMGINPS